MLRRVSKRYLEKGELSRALEIAIQISDELQKNFPIY